MNAAPKVMPLILSCWPMVSEADVGAIVVEGAFCGCVTDGSRGAV